MMVERREKEEKVGAKEEALVSTHPGRLGQ